MPAAVAILVGALSVALSGMMSFGFLMLRTSGSGPQVQAPAFDDARAVVWSPSQVQVWRGVPRYAPDSPVGATVQREFGLFEPEPLELRPAAENWLRLYCMDQRQYRRIEPGVYSLCGGFHADWAVVFERDGRTVELAFCFGCDEVKILVDGHEPLHLELVDSLALRMCFEPYASR